MENRNHFIDESAKRQANLHFHSLHSKDANYACQVCFKAGISFVQQYPEVISNLMNNYAEWVDVNAVRNGSHEWTMGCGMQTKHFTSEELFSEYIKINFLFLNPKR